MVGLPSDDTQLWSENVYVYSCVTGAWSRWTYPTYTMKQVKSGGQMYLAAHGRWDLRFLDPLSTSGVGIDGMWNIGLSPDEGNFYFISNPQSSGWVPEAGDWVLESVDSDEYIGHRIVSVESTGEQYRLELDSPVNSSEGAYGVQSIKVEVQWAGHFVDPSETGLCSEMHLLFDNTSYRMTDRFGVTLLIDNFTTRVGMETDVTPEAELITVSTPRVARMTDHRLLPARSSARAMHYLPKFTTSDIGVAWRCVGVALDMEAVSSRTSR